MYKFLYSANKICAVLLREFYSSIIEKKRAQEITESYWLFIYDFTKILKYLEPINPSACNLS